MVYTIVPLKLDFAAEKKGPWPSRPCGDWSTFSHPYPSEPKEQTAAHRRDALCPSTTIQKQAAFGIRIPSGWRQISPCNFLNSVEYPFCVNVLFGRMVDNELPSPAWKRLSQLKVSPTVARVWDDCRMGGSALFTEHCPANASSCKW